MDTGSNKYTIIFSVVMVVVVASTLAFTATSLAERQGMNRRAEKMQDILHTIGLDSLEKDGKKQFLSRDLAEEGYNKHIKEVLAIRSDGSVDEDVNAFDINLATEIKKPVDEQVFPLYIADKDGEEYYVIPLRGFGLWDAIWGYISLEDDLDTVKGIIFDHKGETAGLGAEITKDFFSNSFKQEKILDKDGNFVGVEVVKGYTGGNDKDDHAVDAISGATITGDGVSDMIKERLERYIPYFKEHTNVEIQEDSK